MKGSDPLSRIGYISLADQPAREIAGFHLDPDIRLPVEFPTDDSGEWRAEAITWEAIVAAILKILAHRPGHEHADYYRSFVLAVKPDIKAELTEAAILKARNREHELAIEILTALEGLFPRDADVKLNLALVWDEKARRGSRGNLAEADSGANEADNERAFQAYKRALEADPAYPQAHYNLAHFYLRQRNFEQAKVHLDAFLKHGRAEDYPAQREKAERISREIGSWGKLDGLFKRAFDAIRMGQEQKGIDAIGEFLARVPDSWNAWFLLGWGRRRLGLYAEAKEAFLKSLELKPANPDTLNELAICLMELGDLDGSRRKLEQALKVEPENTKVISNLGVLALKQGLREEAAGFFRTVLEIDPRDPVAPRYLEELGVPAEDPPAGG